MYRILVLLVAIAVAASVTGCAGGGSASGESTQTDSNTGASQSENTGSADQGAEAEAETIESGTDVAEALAAKLLTPADVEKVSGLAGLKVVKKDPSVGAGGDINIADGDGQLIVMLNVGNEGFYEATKDGQNFGRDYTGVGDASYVGPGKDTFAHEYLLGVKDGDYGLVVTSFLDTAKQGKPFLTLKQLQALAEVAMSRL